MDFGIFPSGKRALISSSDRPSSGDGPCSVRAAILSTTEVGLALASRLADLMSSGIGPGLKSG